MNTSNNLIRTAGGVLLAAVCAFETLSAACNDGNNKDKDAASTMLVYSYDPNDIIGPAGKGPERSVSRGERLEYTIDFENQTNATAAAQMIVITLPEDPNLDWTTLELGAIALGNQIDLNFSGKGAGESSFGIVSETGYQVRTSVVESDGSLVWTLRIWDASTYDNFPDDAKAGILPPNNPETHCGEGFVKYSVCVKTNAVPGSVVTAKGTIVFDANAPIDTDPFWTNTVGLDMKVEPFVDGIGYRGPWDGEPHGIDVIVVEPAEGAVVKYCETEDGTYTTTPVTYTEVGTNTVFFTVEKEGYVPYSGSAKVIINENDQSPLMIEPGDLSRVYATEAAATNERPRLVVAYPADLAEFATAEEKLAYRALFHVVTKQSGGTWRNVVEFTPAATESLRATLNNALKTFDLSKITTEDTNWVVPNPVKGLYYALERTDSLDASFTIHQWDLGNSVSVTFTVNETGKRSGFFRLLISACPPE